ncbi:MAG TPA: serine protease [Planktothrix sp.]|jgi:hypothetical protein
MSSRSNVEAAEQYQSNDSVSLKSNENVERPYSKESFEKGEGQHLYIPASSDWGEGNDSVQSVHSMLGNVEDSKTQMSMNSAWEGDSWNGQDSPLSAQHALKDQSDEHSDRDQSDKQSDRDQSDEHGTRNQSDQHAYQDQCDGGSSGGSGGGGDAGAGDTGGGSTGGGSTGGGDTGGGTATAGGDGVTIPVETDGSAAPAAVQNAEASTVQITADDGDGEESLGSGFFVSSNGYIATDYHVVQGAQGPIQITTADGQTLEAEPVVTDQANDIAILKIVGDGSDQSFTALNLSQDDTDAGGEDFAIGHPEGDPNIVVSSGNYEGQTNFGSFDVTDNTVADNPNRLLDEFGNMDTQPGSSGSPILNANGQVIAMDDIGDGEGNADGTLASSIASDLAEAEAA